MHVRMSGDPVAEGPHIKICQQDDGTNTQIGAKHELVEAERASVAVTTYQVESGGVIADRTGVLSSGCLLLLPPLHLLRLPTHLHNVYCILMIDLLRHTHRQAYSAAAWWKQFCRHSKMELYSGAFRFGFVTVLSPRREKVLGLLT